MDGKIGPINSVPYSVEGNHSPAAQRGISQASKSGFNIVQCKAFIVNHEPTMHRLERGARLIGTDAWSWAATFVHSRKVYEASGNPA